MTTTQTEIDTIPDTTDNKLTPEQLEAFGEELDAIRQRVIADLGEEDAAYIRKRREDASAASRSPAGRCSTCRRPGRSPSPR